ncbi:LacI family DNA-binding transcriptional regulator [Companilactobacillus huachuanensis]|uniref:LacI family DNA-binding transcriptional regulator n=1 Tax=Companilactobacillus huachuanensis TaxID=2559914 RepID=A0ABW1RKV7_9LACO|nr:LacI family DNA-binding transcriptional regulator [Companilactobacillus huachuanensis]
MLITKKHDITIKEISKLSGASTSTVSRVLNESGYVSTEKRQAIEKVIRETNYRPSMIARSLHSKQTKTLAVVLPDVSNPYFIGLIEEIEHVSEGYGYTLILINTMSTGADKMNAVDDPEVKALHTIQEKHVDGAVIIGGEIDHVNVDSQYLKTLNELNKQIPVVIIAQKVENCDCIFVQRHINTGMRLIVQHILSLGYRKIGFLGGKPGVRVTEQRLAEFEKLVKMYTDYDDKSVLLNDYYLKDGYQGIEKLLNQTDLNAVVAINDRVALGAVRRLHEMGMNVPKDIVIGSADQFPDSDYYIPSITTINQHNNSLGKIAVEQLIRSFNGQPFLTAESEFPDLVIRESCGEKKYSNVLKK